MVDVGEGVLGIEWIEGKSVRKLLPGGAEEEDEGEEEEEEEELEDPLALFNVSQGTATPGNQLRSKLLNELTDTLMDMIGTEIAKMHQADIIHGDLTTSNMMLRPLSPPQLVGTSILSRSLHNS